MVVSAADVRAVPAVEELVALGRARGLAAVGVTTAEPFSSTRRDLEERKAQGLHGGMAFTYRNPARSTEPERALPDAHTLVVGAWPYLRPESSGPEGGRPRGVVARYARGDHYAGLREALGAIAERLKAHGWRARVLADDNALVDRAAARRAGLGWYGKNANLLLPGQGSWFVLGSVVTDAPLPATGPDDLVPDGCGTCTRCLDGCPTGAIVAPGVVDARRCLAWLLQADGPFVREHRVALGNRIYGCDDCQEVCPPNRRTARRLASADADSPVTASVAGSSVADAERPRRRPTADPLGDLAAGARDTPAAIRGGGDRLAPQERGRGDRRLLEPAGTKSTGGAGDASVIGRSAPDATNGAYVDVIEMLGMSDGELLERFGRWYVPRREARYLRRNALVVLGNAGDPADPVVIAALRRALDDPDPLVRGHAVWAARRMGRGDLAAQLADDPDPLVQEELQAEVEVRPA